MRKISKLKINILMILILSSAFVFASLPVNAFEITDSNQAPYSTVSENPTNSDAPGVVTEYRYKAKFTTKSYDTALEGYIQDGYTLVDKTTSTVNYVSKWPSGFNTSHTLYSKYNNTPVSAYETSTKKVTVESTVVAGCIYWHWCRGTYTAGPINRGIDFVKGSTYKAFHAFETSSAIAFNYSTKAYQSSQSNVCKDTYWWYALNRDAEGQLPIYRETYSQYNKLYNYYKWSGWSDWSASPVAENSDTIVETRIAYLPTCSIKSTSNFKSSQSVTLSLRDVEGLSGYYWGTSSNYKSNTFTATSSTSVSKTISSPGTYYLTAKDLSGNVSSTKSITFYRTSLNANGGTLASGTPSTVLTAKGNSFTPPTPTKKGYTFLGWNTSSIATTGINSITPTSNTAYYAVWKLGRIKQNITANSYNKYCGDKPFYLNAKTSGDGKLSYKSSNKKVATVSSSGKVTIKNCGKATITINATETERYNSVTKTITVKVAMKPVSASSIKWKKTSANSFRISWGKVPKAIGYKIRFSTIYMGQKRERVYTFTKNYASLGNMKKKQSLSIDICSYGKFGKKTYYSTGVAQSIKLR